MRSATHKTDSSRVQSIVRYTRLQLLTNHQEKEVGKDYESKDDRKGTWVIVVTAR